MNYINLNGEMVTPKTENMAYDQTNQRIDVLENKQTSDIEEVNESMNIIVQNFDIQMQNQLQTINNRIDNEKATINSNVSDKMSRIECRMDNIIAHNNDTESNSELIDIRAGTDGIVYESAGSAVRTAVKIMRPKKNFFNHTLIKGTIDDSTGAETYTGSVLRSDFIRVNEGSSIVLSFEKHTGTVTSVFIYEYAEKDTYNEIYNSINIQTGKFTVAQNTKYIRICFRFGGVSADAVPENLYNIQLEYGESKTNYEEYILVPSYSVLAEKAKCIDGMDIQSIADSTLMLLDNSVPHKNIFLSSFETGGFSVVTGAENSQSNQARSGFIEVDSNSNAVLSFNLPEQFVLPSKIYCAQFDNIQNTPLTYTDVTNGNHVTIRPDTSYLRYELQFTQTSDRNQFLNNITDIQLEYGKTPTEYEPTSKQIARYSKFSERADTLIGFDEKEIVCWGDSLTRGGGWTDILAQKTDMPVYNAGEGGESIRTICARQGGDVMMVNNIIIPSDTTPVEIARYSDGGIDTFFGHKAFPVMRGNYGHFNPCKIGDIEGTLTWTGSDFQDTTGTWTFTRSTAGEAMVINRPTAIKSNYDMSHNSPHLMIIFMGQNGGYDGSWDDLILSHKRMIQHSNAKNTIILGITSGSAQTPSFVEYERKMKETFGRYFLCIREYITTPIKDSSDHIISCYGLEDAGLTATANDIEYIAQGKVPPQLLQDSIHYNSYGKTVIGNYIYSVCRDLGIFS